MLSTFPSAYQSQLGISKDYRERPPPSLGQERFSGGGSQHPAQMDGDACERPAEFASREQEGRYLGILYSHLEFPQSECSVNLAVFTQKCPAFHHVSTQMCARSICCAHEYVCDEKLFDMLYVFLKSLLQRSLY